MAITKKVWSTPMVSEVEITEEILALFRSRQPTAAVLAKFETPSAKRQAAG